MKKMTCVHPRKAQKIMKKFVNDASDIVYLTEDDTYEKIEILVQKGEDFSAESPETVLDWSELAITYNFDELYDNSAKLFRAYWAERYPLIKGFADITISLLHELFHLEVNDEIRKTFTYDDRKLALYALYDAPMSNEERNRIYFGLPDEAAATEGAIKWLSVKENAKKAKKFEKEFFKCFE